MGEFIHNLRLRQSIEIKDCTCVNQSIKNGVALFEH